MLSQQGKLLATAVIASLSLSACGKKKDLYADPAQPVTTTAAPAPTTATSVPSTATPDSKKADPIANLNGKTQPGLGGGLSNTGELPVPPGTETIPGGISRNNNSGNNNNNNGDNADNGDSQGDSVRPLAPPNVIETRSLPINPGSNNTLPDYNPRDPKNLERSGLSKRITGGATEDGTLYTSSSTDQLMDFLRARNEKMSYGTRALNKAAAASVVSASLNVDGSSGEAVVTLRVIENKELKVYRLVGFTGEGEASKLRVISDKDTSAGRRPITNATLKCLDIDGTCENVFVRLHIGAKGESAVVNVAFRQSPADLYFSLNPASGNHEYDIMRDFAYNTIQDNVSLNKVDLNQVRLSSWEVVNGRSGFTASIKAMNHELLAFSGPLLAPEFGTGVNYSLTRVTKDSDTSSDLVYLNDVSLNYQNMIADARLIANNGLGQIRILLKMRTRVGYSRDQFAITYLRKIKPIIELSDENLK